jgi:TRAP-type mannitol/chloroaromatic compound transport system permease small subunit
MSYKFSNAQTTAAEKIGFEMKKAFLRYVDAINSWVGRVIGFAVIPITVIATIEVVLRYIFNRPTIWAWEINIQLMASMAILGAGYALLHGAHVKMDVFVERFSPRTRALIDLTTAVLFFFICVIIIYESAIMAWRAIEIREIFPSPLASPVYIFKSLLPFGAFLLLLQGIAKFIRDLDIVFSSKRRHKIER